MLSRPRHTVSRHVLPSYDPLGCVEMTRVVGSQRDMPGLLTMVSRLGPSNANIATRCDSAAHESVSSDKQLS